MLAAIEGARLLTPPASEPVTLERVKAHLRVDGDEENDLISTLIVVARQYVEQRCWCALINQTWILGLDTWPFEPLRLPMTPLLTRPTIVAVRYRDSSGSPVTLSSSVYTVLATGEFTLVHDQNWPGDVWTQWSIEIEYTVGYGATAQSVPAPLVAVIKLLAGHLYENREAVSVGAGVAVSSVPLAVDSLLALYEVR